MEAIALDEMYKRIEQLCREAGVNVTTMCREAGVPRSALSDYKAGRIKSLAADKLAKIAGYFNVSVDHLLGKEEKPAAPKDGEPDVKEALTDMAKRAAQGALLMYDGEPLDAETQRAFEASLRVVIATLEGRRGK